MKRPILILLSLLVALGLLAILGYLYFFFTIGMEPIPSRTQLLDELYRTQNIEIQARDDQEHIHGLLLEVHGNISDSLTFSFGTNDSTIYRTEKLVPGIVDYKYSGDWYSTLCFLTFEPRTDKIDGELQLEYKFFGE